CDDSGFSPTTPPWRAGKIVGIVRSSIDKIVGLICERELWKVGLSQHDCSCCTHTRYRGSILLRDVGCTAFGACWGDDTLSIDRTSCYNNRMCSACCASLILDLIVTTY